MTAQKDRQRNAKPTKVHTPDKQDKRVDKHKGKEYDDWFEQIKAEMEDEK